MTDISIGKASEGLIVSKKTQKSEFEVLKKEYNSFKKKAAKSDMANSPVMLEKEYDLLQKLSIAAKNETLENEQAWIDKRITEIQNSLAEQGQTLKLPVYPMPSFKGLSAKNTAFNPNEDVDNLKILENYKKADGTIDENAQAIVTAFDSSIADGYSLSYLLKKCCDDDGAIPDDIAQAVSILAKASVKPVIIPQILESIVAENDSGKDVLNLSMCSKIADFKKADFDDFEALKLVRFLNSDFEDKASVETKILKMKKAGISTDSIIKILDSLAVKSTDTSLRTISDSAVKSVVSLKKALVSTRSNEKAERDNPINHLGVITIKFGNDVMIMKDNKVTYISPVEGESVHDLRKEYSEIISKIEDNLLLEYVKKYRDKNGEIDSKSLRIMSVLRNNGIPYDQLLSMTDFCLEENGINAHKLNTITQIKSSGALGIDILPLLNVVEKEQDGSYSSEDIKNICALSSAVIGGKEVSALLPEVRGNENIKEFFVYFSQFFEDKSNLLKLLPLIKDEEGNIDENAMDVLYVLAHNFFVVAAEPMNEEQFVQNANDIVYAAMNEDEINVNDEGAGICSIMCQNGERYEDILFMLQQCKDSSGKINSKLSEILWELSVGKTQIQDIKSAIEFCKTADGDIDNMRADSLISLFEKGYPQDKVIDYIKNMN